MLPIGWKHIITDYANSLLNFYIGLKLKLHIIVLHYDSNVQIVFHGQLVHFIPAMNMKVDHSSTSRLPNILLTYFISQPLRYSRATRIFVRA